MVRVIGVLGSGLWDGWYFLLGIKVASFTFANFLFLCNIMMVELDRDMCKWDLANFGVLLYDDDEDGVDDDDDDDVNDLLYR